MPGSKPFKAFLEGQMSKDKPSPLLAIKNPTFWTWWPVIFFKQSHLVFYSMYSLTVISLCHPQQFLRKNGVNRV